MTGKKWLKGHDPEYEQCTRLQSHLSELNKYRPTTIRFANAFWPNPLIFPSASLIRSATLHRRDHVKMLKMDFPRMVVIHYSDTLVFLALEVKSINLELLREGTYSLRFWPILMRVLYFIVMPLAALQGLCENNEFSRGFLRTPFTRAQHHV